MMNSLVRRREDQRVHGYYTTHCQVSSFHNIHLVFHSLCLLHCITWQAKIIPPEAPCLVALHLGRFVSLCRFQNLLW